METGVGRDEMSRKDGKSDERFSNAGRQQRITILDKLAGELIGVVDVKFPVAMCWDDRFVVRRYEGVQPKYGTGSVNDVMGSCMPLGHIHAQGWE